jgi:hypothetical protein
LERGHPCPPAASGRKTGGPGMPALQFLELYFARLLNSESIKNEPFSKKYSVLILFDVNSPLKSQKSID